MDVYTDYGPNPSNKIWQTYCLSLPELLLIRFPKSQRQGWFAQLKRSAMLRLQWTKSRQLRTALRFRTNEQAFGTFFFFFSHCFITTADQLCGRHINQLENYKTFTQQWRGTFTTFNCLQTYRNYRLNGDPQDTEAGLFLLVILLKTTVNIKHLGRKSSVSVFCHLASVISPLGFVLQCPQLQMFSKWFALNLIRPAKHRRIVSVKV